MNVSAAPKKLVVINDVAGFGRCAATIVLPVVSVLGVQACLVPTAVFSNHTGYPTWHFDDYTQRMPLYLDAWKRLSLTFDGIYAGFLGSDSQADIIEEFLSEHPESLVLVDPVMGDHGRTYSTVTQRHCERIRDLVKKADMITPNVTEACLLTDTAYKESGWSLSELHDLAGKLQKLGPKKAVITGIAGDNCLINYYYETASSDAAGIRTGICESPFAGPNHHGTGDIFASVLAADALNGVPFSASVQKASDFVRMCIAGTCALGLPEEEGVCFENYLGELIRLGHNNGGNNIGQQTCTKACNTEYNPD